METDPPVCLSLLCVACSAHSWLFQQPLRMSPIPPESLERLLLHGRQGGVEPESSAMRELLTKLALSRRSKADARLVAQLKKGEACSWQHIDALVKQRLETWWREWREDDEDAQQQADGGQEEAEDSVENGDEVDGAEEEEGEEEDSKPLPGQSHDYTGPDFSTFSLTCPLPASFTFFSLSLRQRVVLLRCFCDDHLAFAEDFASTVRGVEAGDARIPPLGSDAWGHRYFFFGFPDSRVYREDNAKPIKPRELKAARQAREQAEANSKNGNSEHDEEQRDEVSDDREGEGEEEEEEEAEAEERAVAGKRAKRPTANGKGRSASSTGDDEDDRASSTRARKASTAPRFQLLSHSQATLLALCIAMRSSAHSKDKALSKSLQTIYDDLEQGKGRKDIDGDEQAEEGSGEAEGGAKKRRRKDWSAGGEVAKRSMRLALVMAEKEEQDRRQRMQAEERKKQAQLGKDETIAQLIDTYLHRHGKAKNGRRGRSHAT